MISLLLFLSTSIYSIDDRLLNARSNFWIYSGVYEKGLAHSCLALTTPIDTLPCNPAASAFDNKKRAGLNILISNGQKNLDRIRDLVNDNVQKEDLDSIFGENDLFQIESNSELNVHR